MELGAIQGTSSLAPEALNLAKDLFAQHMRDKIVKPARNRYLSTLDSNAGWSGYSKAQTDSMRRARDIARNEIARAQGNTMASNASIGQRINTMTQVGTNANNTDFYDLNNSLQSNENRGRGNQVGIAEGNYGRQMEGLNQLTSSAERGLSQLSSNPDVQQAVSNKLSEIKGDMTNNVINPAKDKLNQLSNYDLYKQFVGRGN